MTTPAHLLQTESPHGRAARAADKLPPWWAEDLVAVPGRYTSALGKVLDGWATRGPWPVRAALWCLSSIWLGIIWLLLTALYIGVGSGLASVRARLEMTDLQFFDAPPMGILMALTATTLAVVTIRRIPLTVYKLGVWIVHIGIVTLILGCVLYFSQKYEGGVRLFPGRAVNQYFDSTERCLYFTGPDGKTADAPLPRLPYYFEHVSRDRFTDVKTNDPLNLQIDPEYLRPLGSATGDLAVRVTGYLPAAQIQQIGWQPVAAAAAAPTMDDASRAGDVSAIDLMLISKGATFAQWFATASAHDRVLDSSKVSIEYVRHPSAERLAELIMPGLADVAMVVRIPKLKLQQVVNVDGDKPVVVGPYTLAANPMMTNEMPMRSKGYENTISTTLPVDVVRSDAGGEFKFQRMAVSRFPELSPDFVMENGKQKRIQARVDHDLEIDFLDGRKPSFYVVEDEAGKLTVIGRYPGGKVVTQPLTADAPAQVDFDGVPLQFMLLAKIPDAAPLVGPLIIPENQREQRVNAQEAFAHCVVELEVSKAAWKSGPVYVPFSQFRDTRPHYGFPPTVLNVPGVGPMKIELSTTTRPLPSTITLADFQPVKYPGALNSYSDYISTLAAKSADGTERKLVAHLNSPAEDAGLYYFQSAWDGNDNPAPGERFSVIGVANRPGIGVMEIGSILVVVGIGYAFYIKPLLYMIRKRQLAAAVKG